MPISLEITATSPSSYEELYSDAAFINPKYTIAEFKKYLASVTTYFPKYFRIESVKITRISTGNHVAFNEETDKLSQYPGDEYIVEVNVIRKPRGPRKTKTKKGGSRRKTLNRR